MPYQGEPNCLTDFLNDAVATGCVWGLESVEGWAQCTSDRYKDALVIPLWSQPEYAQSHCADEWSDYQPVAIALEELLDDWMTGMHKDALLVGLNWNTDLEGDEFEPLDLLYEFELALKDGI